ncbi:MAG: hypothetical protein PHI63_05635 [Patescibacteria group bacterium]|nr:hypothetical protein [Patescibacteria group bacterium]
MKQLKIILAIIALALAVILIGVFGFRKPAVAPGVNSTPTPVPTPTPMESATPSPTESVTPTPESSPTQTKEVTLEDNNTTITLKVGERFLLKLGEIYDWDISIDDQSIVSRVVNILVVRGAQGVYIAHTPGKAVLTATGDPKCLKSTPRCAIASILFKVNIVVE